MGKLEKFLFSGLDNGENNNKKSKKINKSKKKKKQNLLAITGFILGLISIIFFEFGIIPLLAIIFSAIGLRWKDKRILAIIGLILGIIFFTANLYRNGHLDFDSRTSEEQMIRLDACYDACPGGLFSRKSDGKSPKECKATCREKYAITSEEYNEWIKNKNK